MIKVLCENQATLDSLKGDLDRISPRRRLEGTLSKQVAHLKLRQGNDGQYPGQNSTAGGAGQTGAQGGANQEQLLRQMYMQRYPTGKVRMIGGLCRMLLLADAAKVPPNRVYVRT